ncbi:hypothetical protein R1sor_001231 [Riccia sorocarpa]|uniref:RNA helicase n=1 Tax=Riccia sorocarpa TaxID=122646 RepID=A0ABD3H1D4_9MARC
MNIPATADYSALPMKESNWMQKGRSVVELYAEVGFARGGPRGSLQFEMLEGVCSNLVSIFCEPGEGQRVAIVMLADHTSAFRSFVRLWELRLQGIHQLTPVMCVSLEEMNLVLKPVFLAHITSLLDGDGVKQCVEEERRLRSDIAGTTVKLKKFRKLANYKALKAVVNDTTFRCEQILLKVTEFRNAMHCLADLIMSPRSDDVQVRPVFCLRSDWTWSQLHFIIQRECYRLKAQLPLYARRTEIISHVDSDQVVVLVGETGSGKSTQLVQYLYDAGYAGRGKSIVCTQPRKVAALNLTQRVKEESDGCCSDPFSVGCITSPGAHNYARLRLAEINFTTDFILLQFCLVDPLLSNFSCVVVDEAHERSLNTDLLLAMLKNALRKRPDLKVIIMSATADAELLSAYFHSGEVLRVPGRNFPVHVIYEPGDRPEDCLQVHDEYLKRVVKKVRDIHENGAEGNILAFLTSPAEVDWACSQMLDSSAVALPLHGKLQNEDLRRVFQENSPGRRKIVFATNFAETSLTIPDVRYVVDSGVAKESTFDPKKGMNVLQVGRIDQSSAIQRAGRAGRTQIGICYRLYRQAEFEAFASHRLPEIKRVHLGVAILKLLALGIKDVENFDFVEPPDPQAIQLALRVLDQLGAVKQASAGIAGRSLTRLGWSLVKLAIEPRLGKILLDSQQQGFAQDGLVIAALMSNSGTVFYRSGPEGVKERADRLKMRFCHPHGELFTLLSVYQEWESQPERYRNQWCLRNCISSKAMKRCQDQVNEMKNCLRYELKLSVPPTYKWSPDQPLESSTPLRKIIFAALASNLAVFSGHDRFGYSVVSSGQQARLHPSSSILVFGSTPDFVVYGEILHTSNTFLDLVTVVEPEWIHSLGSTLQYDVAALQASIMRQWVVPVTSSSFLSRLCGKQGQNLMLLKQSIQEQHHERCVIDLSYDNNVMTVYTTPKQMGTAQEQVDKLMKKEKRWMENEALEKRLVTSANSFPSPSVIVGAGAVIIDVLMPGESASVEILYEHSAGLDDREEEKLLEFSDLCGEGLAGFEKHSRGSEASPGLVRWGIVRYRSGSSARSAVEFLNGFSLSGGNIKLTARIPEESSTNSFSRAPLPAVKATLAWARRRRKGWASVRCDPKDAPVILETVTGNLHKVGPCFHIKPDRAKENSLFLMGLQRDVDENSLQDLLFEVSGCRVLDCYMPRSPAPIPQPSVKTVHEEIVQFVSLYVERDKFHVLVFEPKERDYITRAEIRFDENVHEDAAIALKALEGYVIPGCKYWQTISTKRMFSSQVHMSRLMCGILKQEMEELVAALQERYKDARIVITSRDSGAQRVQVSAPSLAVVAQCKCALENLLEGQAISGEDLDESAVRLIFTKRGSQISRAVEMLTKTLILCDKRTQVAKIYGPSEKKAEALKEVVTRLKKLDSVMKSRQIVLRGEGIPVGLMREVIRTYGLDLEGLRSLAGSDAKLTVDHRSHRLLVNGGDMEGVLRIQAAVGEMAQRLAGASSDRESIGGGILQWSLGEEECSICFCLMEDKYSLEGCGHSFCRSCLIDQMNSSIRHRDGFPVSCAYEDCNLHLVLADIPRLLTGEQQDELYRASLGAFVAQNPLWYRFCTTADCPNVYRVTKTGDRFQCAACSVQICTACHVEYHEDLSCVEYARYRVDPDASLQAWREGKIDVKNCPCCGRVIEKVDGCNHMLCICGKHVCWACLMTFVDASPCYDHLRTAHDTLELLLVE